MDMKSIDIFFFPEMLFLPMYFVFRYMLGRYNSGVFESRRWLAFNRCFFASIWLGVIVIVILSAMTRLDEPDLLTAITIVIYLPIGVYALVMFFLCILKDEKEFHAFMLNQESKPSDIDLW